MATALSLVILICLPAAFFVAIMYFQDLSGFARALEAEHPEIIQSVRTLGLFPAGRSKAAYKILLGVKNGTYQGVALSKNAMSACSSAKRLLYVYIVLFFILIAAFLSYSALNPGPQA